MFPLGMAAAELFILTLGVGIPLVKGASLADIPEGQWAALNSTVNGRLHAAAPISRPCFPNAGSNVTGNVDEGECEAVMQHYMDPGKCFQEIHMCYVVYRPTLHHRHSKQYIRGIHECRLHDVSISCLTFDMHDSIDRMGDLPSNVRAVPTGLHEPS